MMLMGLVCWLSADRRVLDTSFRWRSVEASRTRGFLAGIVAATFVAMATPLVWTTYRPRALPWPLESYFNGVHTYGTPQPWLFPLFPWAAFAFAGLAIGFFLITDMAKRYEALILAALGGLGVLACFLSIKLDVSPIHLYPQYDYWHTSPNFFLMRCGVLLILLFCVYAWCRWGVAQLGFSPVIQLGKTSLLVYWVHIELVYGQLSILPKHKCSIQLASVGLAIIFVAMLVVSLLRTNWKDRHAKTQAVPSAAAPARA
jgi:fucose 4-O-acetylase-like acetyltransferase